MKVRGRVLRDTTNGDGLIGSDGKQYEFKLEEVWKSDLPPKPGMIVELELNADNIVVGIDVVDETKLAKEQAEKALELIKSKSGSAYEALSTRVGSSVLIATAVLLVSWIFLTTISIQVTSTMKYSMTFWDIIGIANISGGIESFQNGGDEDVGLYGLMLFFALAGPFLFQFWKDPIAHLGNFLPLIFMAFIAISIYVDIQASIVAASNVSSFFGGARSGRFAENMLNEMLQAIYQSMHLGIGAYLSLIASSYLAVIGAMKFLVAKA